MNILTNKYLILAILPYLIGGAFFLSDGYLAKKEKETAPVSQDGFIGEIKMFGGNFAPRGWALCEGQLLPISSHSALFSILGTTYGGDGRTTFGLPDLRGRTAVGAGTGPGLRNWRTGQKYGAETASLKNKAVALQSSTQRNQTVTLVDPGAQVSITQPSICVNYIICLEGTYPSRN